MFDQFLESNHNFICDFNPSSEDMDVEVVTAEGAIPEVVMEADGASPEVAEVLPEVLKAPWKFRPKPTPTKESVKDKKGKQAAILVCMFPRRNMPKDKPTAQENGKTINLEMEEEEIYDIPMDDEDLGVEVEDIEVECSAPITKLPEYVPPGKGKTKVSKDIDESKVTLHIPLLLDEISFEGPYLGQVPLLKLEYWDLADTEKFPHLVT